MTFSIPEVDQLGWGQPLKNHLAQLNDPETGGLIHVLNVAERDSKFWPNGATDKDEYANKTIYVVETGTFHVWTVSTTSSNNRYWRELSKNISFSELLVGPGMLTGLGYDGSERDTIFQMSGSTASLLDFVEEDQSIELIKQDGTKVLFRIKSVDSATQMRVYGVGFSHSSPWGSLSISFTTNSDIITITTTGGNPMPVVGDGITISYYSKSIKEVLGGNQFRVNSPYIPIPNTIYSGSNTAYTGGGLILYKFTNVSWKFGNYLQKWTDGQNRKLLIDRNLDIYTPRTFTNERVVNNYVSSTFLGQGMQQFSVDRKAGDRLEERGFLSIAVQHHFEEPNNQGYYQNLWKDSIFTASHTIRMYSQNGQICLTADSVENLNQSNPHLLIARGGNIGISISSPSERFHVNGNILATGTILSGSDKRWKEDIVKIDSALSKISLLEGIIYSWKDKEVRGSGRRMGLIGQDVEKAFPEAVIKDEEGYLSVNYDGLVGALVESTKELKATIDFLTERIVMLESKQ